MPTNDQNLYYDQTLVSPLSTLETKYNIESGITPILLPQGQENKTISFFTPTEEQIKTQSVETTTPETPTPLATTKSSTTPATIPTIQIQISPDTYTKLNPLSYAYIITSPTSIDIQLMEK